MERKPIISETSSVEVVMVQDPVTLKDLLPKYSYQFQTGEVSEEAMAMYASLVEFLDTNDELIPFKDISEDYVKGFQQAISLTRLWVDSMYLEV